MDTLKRTIIAVLALVPLLALPALAEPEHGYNRLFIFGDSLSDSGNRFAVNGETTHPPFEPVPDAPYGVGGHHYSNGRTWVEVMAQEMGLTEWAKPAYRDSAFGNYAYGGARARSFNPTAPSFGDQVQAWIGAGHCTQLPMSDTLFVVQFGGNDLRDALEAYLGGQNPAPIVADAINGMITNIAILAQCGAQHILIANAPNLGAAPLVPDVFKGDVTGLSWQFNQNLNAAVAFFLSGLNISIVDFFGFVTGATMMPEAFGLENVASSCLSFGVVKDAFCKDRDGYLFWDAVHPTKKAHALIGEIALGQLPVSN
jgi:phospholipase/lecithinase/hemolysin